MVTRKPGGAPLWDKRMYKASGNTEKERALVQYAPLVKRIAHYLMLKLPPSVQVDDMIQVGMLGLLDAINRYQESGEAQFETYAAMRIRGAMLDELRETDWLPRTQRQNMRRIEAAIRALEQRNGRQPSEQELASELGIPLADYQRMLQELQGCQLVYYEDFDDEHEEHFIDRHCSQSHPGPLEALEDQGLKAILANAIDGLPPRESLVVNLYYKEELNLREIAEVMGVTESRVCQLHTQAIARLRSRFRGGSVEQLQSTGDASGPERKREARQARG